MHQASELWFKEILHELDGLIDAFEQREAEFALFRMGRINALMRIVSAQLSALETLPPQHFAEFRDYLGTLERIAERAVPRDRGGVRAARAALHARARGARRDPAARAARARAADAAGALPRAAAQRSGVELEALYVGARPTTLFFLAEALLEYEQQFGLWRFQHVQLVERVLGPLTGGTGGTLGAKYLARTIDQKFFPALWAVRAKFYGAPG